MSGPNFVLPVKLIVAALYVDSSLLEKARHRLQQEFGPTDYISPSFPFEPSEYYEEEMGAPISRIFLSFRDLIEAPTIVQIKLKTNGMESEFVREGKRVVNLDSGYMDHAKVVLASMKKNNPKIYLGEGVYADMNLLYERGHYKALPWTFPDFRGNQYEQALLHIRAKYKAAIRKQFPSL